MENHYSKSVNCCFCDKNLSQNSQSNPNTVIKYKCPACDKLYCSASCCCGHKEKFNCPGIRNKTPYVHRSNFDQRQFLDDYFFLEEVNNKIESSQRILPTVSNKIKTKKRKFRRNCKKRPKVEPNIQQKSDDSK